MNVKMGIWIDTRKALIVTINDAEARFIKVESGIDAKEREEGETDQRGRFGSQDIDTEKGKQARFEKEEKHFFKTIINQLAGVEELVLFGPSSTKNRLHKEVEGMNTLKLDLKMAEVADSMTDNQVRAWVVDYYKKLD